jgi:UPF0176 protein
MDFQILLYYKYVHIDDPEALMKEQRLLCEELGFTGRIIVAEEGINGTVEGTKESTEKYMEEMRKDPRFADVHFKTSFGDGKSFPKLSVKVRSEIVSAHLGYDDIDPNEVTGKYLEAEELYKWIHEGKKEFYIVDMRNDYEHKVGYFEGSILAPLKNFRELPEKLEEIAHLKNKTVVTVCTGGVRCEKASGFLIKHGFKDVYQLHNGIHSYMEKYPNQDFKGKLYVFDGRVTMGFNLDSPEHEIVSSCDKCGEKNDIYADCSYLHCKGHRHFICCENCRDAEGRAFCSVECEGKFHTENDLEVSINSADKTNHSALSS